jgi:CheY-like chemotaxis protein
MPSPNLNSLGNSVLDLRMEAKKAGVPFSIRLVGDGEQAIEYLSGEGKYTDRATYPFPKAILLDLKMPRRNGFEVLEWKEQQPELKSLPVVVWSSSNLEQDRRRALVLGAANYLCKPADYDGLIEIIRCLEQYCRAKNET